MNHAQSSTSAYLRYDSTFTKRWLLILRSGMRRRGVSVALCLIALCLVLLPGSPAMSQPAANDKLAPRERIELRVWRWTALQGGLLEGLQLNHTFSIDAAGQLELPN